MESLVKPVLTIKYEIARQIILALLQRGFLSRAEFDAIDAENEKSFA